MTKYMYLKARDVLSRDSDGYNNPEYAEKVFRKILLNGFDWANKLKVEDFPNKIIADYSYEEFIVHTCYWFVWELRNNFENFMEFVSIYEQDNLYKMED